MVNETPPAQHVPHSTSKEFFLARQPILDREQQLYAYELLFRGAHEGGAVVSDDLLATATVIAHVAELGLEAVVGPVRGFLNIDASVLHSDFIRFVPPDRAVLEILETVIATPEVIDRIQELRKLGYTFALDDVVADSSDVRALAPLVDIVKIDITGMADDQLRALVGDQRTRGKKLLAEKLETVAEFELCLALGFDYFQGYYFAKPMIMKGKKLAACDLAILDLLKLLDSDADNADIEQRLKRDATLAIKVLRMVNTPAAGARKHIDTLGQALVVLGRRQLQRWLQVLLYAQPPNGGIGSPLLALAITRAKLLELIVAELHPAQRAMADAAFALGVMSLMDVLFSLPMEDLLKSIEVNNEIRCALLSRGGKYGELLTLVEQLENGQVPLSTLHKMQLEIATLNALQLRAFEWASKVVEVT